MIAIDTNVLLRYLLADDKVQSRKAAALITGNSRVLVTDVVLMETIWTLKGKKYKLDKDGILDVIDSMFEEPGIFFEDGQTVWRAYSDYKKATPVKVGRKRKQADFADALVVNKSRHIASSAGELLEGVFTFDVAAQSIPGAKAP